MPSLSSIIYHKAKKKYGIIVQNDKGQTIMCEYWFETQAEAEAFLDAECDRVGASRGEEIPVRRQ